MATVALNSDGGKPEGPWLRQPRMHRSPWAAELTGPRGHSPWQAVEPGAGSGAGSVFIYSWNAAAVWPLFNRALVKFLEKNKLRLAVKQQPPNSQTDVEVMDQGPKTDGFVRRACLVRAHLLAVRRPRQKPTLCWGVWTQKRKKLGKNAEGRDGRGGKRKPRWVRAATGTSSRLFVPKQKSVKGMGTGWRVLAPGELIPTASPLHGRRVRPLSQEGASQRSPGTLHWGGKTTCQEQ